MSSATHPVRFREARADDPEARGLLAEYFESRRESFPGPGEYVTTWPDPERFAPPNGVFLVVEGDAGESLPIGCGGIRSVEGPEGAARFEVKHLWLRPAARGTGLGRALLAELERRARELGATELVLDTNDSLEAAGGLYRSSGFETIAPYHDNRNANHWYGKRL